MQAHVLQTILMFRMDSSIILPNRLQVIGISYNRENLYITLPNLINNKYTHPNLFIHVLHVD